MIKYYVKHELKKVKECPKPEKSHFKLPQVTICFLIEKNERKTMVKLVFDQDVQIPRKYTSKSRKKEKNFEKIPKPHFLYIFRIRKARATRRYI